ncbi:MAG: FtsK/SpoIIIE domain-containing protein [Actinomycetota bacterium]
MRVVHRSGRHETPAGAGRRDRIVTLDITDPSATVGDVAAALSRQATVPTAGLTVDGRWHPPSAAAADLALHVGSVLEPSLTPPTSPPAPARVLAVVGGLRAGGASPLDGRTAVGRGGLCSVVLDDPTVGRRHVQFDGARVEADPNATNPVLVDGAAVASGDLAPDSVVTVGATQLASRIALDDRPLAVREGLGRTAGLLPFNRPPRFSPAVQAPTLHVPAEPPDPERVEPPSFAALVLPVIAGAVMAVLFSPYMAIFTALGPTLLLGTWWERRRRARRAHRRAVREVAAAVADVGATIDDRRDAERTRRRAVVPDPAEVVRRASTGSVRLWERRAGDDDAFLVGVGAVTEPYAPELVTDDGEPATAVVELIASAAPLVDLPLPLTLAPGTTLGVVGTPPARQAVARSLTLQLATHHGPSDLAISVVAETEHLGAWHWSTWLPHTVDRVTGDLPLAPIGPDGAEQLSGRLAAADTAHLVVLDGDTMFEGRGAPGRRATAADHSIVVALVDDTHRLPAGCDHIVVVDEFGRVELLDPRIDGVGVRGLAWGIAPGDAESAARGLARFDDPELSCAGAGIPDRANLLGLLGIDTTPAEIEARWGRSRGSAALVAPIGRDGDGPVELDLVGDGPHLLVGGTTGAGKSELLRSLVASFAATADPDHVAFVLVDYKGGAAFDCCADLPHVAGLVTDLDADLAARALRCLDAELHRRELLLRSVGAEDLAAYRAATASAAAAEPLPRLVLVVDEFASLAADLPDFLDALVGIAQRGRSLGVHMILATQRPAGVVTEDIRANTGCRIALRVTGRNESTDIIDAPDAAAIPRTRPGRAVARFGPSELVGFQSALVTGRSSSTAPVQVSWPFGDISLDDIATDDASGPSDLERLVDAIRVAHGDRPLPKAPWPEPLPDAGVADDAGWWLVDRPEQQRQTVEGWTPADGHLVVLGGPGSGVSTTLVAAACVAIDGGAHLHGVDLDAGMLTGLSDLPSAGTIAAPVDAERRLRVLRWLAGEVDRRRANPEIDHQPIVFVIDDLGGFSRAHDPVRATAPHDQLEAIWAAGPSVGVTVVVGLRRAAELPPALVAGAGSMLAHRVLDPGDAHRFGLRDVPSAMPPGRAIRAADGAQLHVLIPDGDVGRAVDRRRSVRPATPPMRIGTLGTNVDLDDVLADAPATDGAALRLPIGRLDADLSPAILELHPGDHALVMGPGRSGRTTALATIGTAARSAGWRCVVTGARSAALAEMLGVEWLDASDLPVSLDRTVVLIDGAMDELDPAGRLAALSAERSVHVIAADRADRIRSAYGHWVKELASSRTGVLLQPDPIDGDLLGAPLPGRLDLAPVPGRGVVINAGRFEPAHIARFQP